MNYFNSMVVAFRSYVLQIMCSYTFSSCIVTKSVFGVRQKNSSLLNINGRSPIVAFNTNPFLIKNIASAYIEHNSK